ncbi:FAD:protein FMN transferase [Tahibacter sp.]|uniref:FAD:protein FMN transferase n=1 Tax=Tahibacter sp. TaxID=2056211 RepID=UPI0028C47A42|nr:FAD:protein FMN transferase [Tahibacter sp.]
MNLAMLARRVLPRRVLRWPVRAWSGDSMGTHWSVKVCARRRPDAAVVRAAIEAELDRVDRQMSTWRADSDLSRYNTAAGPVWVELPDDCYRVVTTALAVARETGGAYDPTVGRLVNLWGFGPDGTRESPPPAAAIERARADCGWQRLRCDDARHAVWQPGGVFLDLSAIAKGFAVDQVCASLERHGIHDYLVEVGGELRARGFRGDGRPWYVAIESPEKQAEMPLIGVLRDGAIATSGDYLRYFETAGQRYSHTIDPRTAEPVSHALAAVSVLHDETMLADAYATAFSVLGADDGLAFAQRHGIAARFVSRAAQGLATVESSAFARFRYA